MKKLLLSLILACSATAPSWAVKAWPFPVEVTQSDGTRLTILNRGDEHFHYFTTTDGVLLVRTDGSYYIAAVQADGTLTSTGILAHNADNRTEAEQKAATRQNLEPLQHRENAQRTAARIVKKESYASFPWKSTENPHVLIILAQFPDMPFHTTEKINGVETELDTKTIFEQYFNATGTIDKSYGTVSKNHGSVKQYFSDMSGGQFTPQFDIYGPVTLDNNYAYYGKGSSDNMKAFVPEVCKKADEAGVDFSQYDQNNDGYVDLVYIVYAGWGENIGTNSTDCIWPKSGITSGGTYDGKNVALYGVNNEMNGNDPTTGRATMWINGIGTFCHEFSHCLGLPDFYTTTSGTVQTANNQTMGFYDLMDMGNFQNNSYSPRAYTAFERETLGWGDIVDLEESGSYTTQSLCDNGKAYRVRNPLNKNEYIVVENIQNKAWDNTKYIGHGLLAYHVDYDENIFNVLTGNSKDNTVNNTLGHPHMAVIPADGLMLNDKNAAAASYDFYTQQCGDTFSDKSQSGVKQLTDDSQLPNFLFYKSTTGGKTNFALKNITEHADGSVTFDYTTDVASGIRHTETSADNADNRIYTLNGTCMGTDLDALPKGVYIKNHKKIVKE